MSIWAASKQATVAALNSHTSGSAVKHLGIEFTEIGEQHLSARLPVDERTRQPYGILHGGVSCVLAETIASTAAFLTVEGAGSVVGLEINANHIRSVADGWVYGTASPVHLGRSTQVWSIQIDDEQGKLVCMSRMTIMIKRPTP